MIWSDFNKYLIFYKNILSFRSRSSNNKEQEETIATISNEMKCYFEKTH